MILNKYLLTFLRWIFKRNLSTHRRPERNFLQHKTYEYKNITFRSLRLKCPFPCNNKGFSIWRSLKFYVRLHYEGSAGSASGPRVISSAAINKRKVRVAFGNQFGGSNPRVLMGNVPFSHVPFLNYLKIVSF